MKRVVAIFIIIFAYLQAYPQEQFPRYGLFGGYNLNQHSADFQKLPGIPNCCPRFETGNGNGLSGSLLYEMPLFSDLYLGLRITYYDFSAKLTKEEPTTVIINDKPRTGAFTHTLNSKLGGIGFEPMIQYNAFGGLLLNFGIHLGYLFTKKYYQQEQISQPAGIGTFADSNGNDTHSRLRNQSSGIIPRASTIYLSGLVGIGYDFPLNSKGSLIATPEVLYSFGLSEIVKDYKWKANTLRVGLALKYSQIPERKIDTIYKQENRIDTVEIETKIAGKIFSYGEEKIFTVYNLKDYNYIITKILRRTDTIFTYIIPKLEVDVTAVGLDFSGQEIPIPEIHIEEFFTTNTQPLLNYVFFSENSSEIPDRYNKLQFEQTKEFTEDSLHSLGTLETYYHILNIIGKRLRDNQNEKITLVGCNSEIGLERNNKTLSESRAKAVRDYLEKVWKIDISRIKIEARGLPSKPSTPKDEPDPIEENQRVEIYGNWEILKPVFTYDTLRVVNIPTLRFKPKIISEAGIKDWNLILSQNKINLKIFKGNTIPAQNLDFSFDKSNTPKNEITIEYKLSATDSINQNKIQQKSIPVSLKTIKSKRQKGTADKEIDKYSLILFDFDSDQVKENNKKIAEFVRSRIMYNSTVVITGHTDRTGSDEYNQNLSERRAKATARALGLSEEIAFGLGENPLLFPNDTPEARFYCRTVVITVETPIK